MTDGQRINEFIEGLEYIRSQAELIYGGIMTGGIAVDHFGTPREGIEALRGMLDTLAAATNWLCCALSKLPDDTYGLLDSLGALPISAANGKGGAAK